MNDWLPCLLGLAYIAVAVGLGYLAGCYREQLRLLEILKPETRLAVKAQLDFKMNLLQPLAALACLLTGLHAHAGPMGFKDSTMAMGDLGPNWREAWVNHALTPRDALGAGGIWMRSDDKQITREFAEVNYTRLVKRWNAEHSQANVWFVGGVGPVRGTGFAGSRLMLAPGLSADFETARLYVSATARLYRASGINHDYGAVRAGFSFYETDYDETQPWLIVEARRMRGLSESTEITPMLRFINKRYFIETGVSTSKQARFNFMYIF